jgi:hypothetical protein
MKFIPFGRHGEFAAKDFLVSMLRTSPAGQDLGEMRDRLKVLKKLESAPPEGATLEDGEHATLMRVLNGRRDFAITSGDIIEIADAVLNAKEPATSVT